MKAQIEIDATISNVFELYINKKNYGQWKSGFVNYELVSGQPDEKGSAVLLHYQNYTMTETVEEIDKPDRYVTRYERLQNGKPMMTHIADSQFTAIDANKTRITINSDVVKVNGFIMKLMITLMAKLGEKQLNDQLKSFKIMVEKPIS
jgi:Polyketide cyclase / dehydrase and lipid transport